MKYDIITKYFWEKCTFLYNYKLQYKLEDKNNDLKYYNKKLFSRNTRNVQKTLTHSINSKDREILYSKDSQKFFVFN